MGKQVKVVVLKGFSTSDASGVVTGKKGDELILDEFTAKRLAKAKFIRKYRKGKQDG